MSGKAMSLKEKIRNLARKKDMSAQVVLQNYMFGLATYSSSLVLMRKVKMRLTIFIKTSDSANFSRYFSASSGVIESKLSSPSPQEMRVLAMMP